MHDITILFIMLLVLISIKWFLVLANKLKEIEEEKEKDNNA